VGLLGKNWVKNILLTAGVWPGSIVCIGGYINTIAIFYSSSKAIPFPVMVKTDTDEKGIDANRFV
jgi:transmembrane 9 superfamily protein 3